MNEHRCFYKVKNNKASLRDFPCYIFTCEGCHKQKLVTKRTFWRVHG